MTTKEFCQRFASGIAAQEERFGKDFLLTETRWFILQEFENASLFDQHLAAMLTNVCPFDLANLADANL